MTEITGTLRMARRVTPQEDIRGPCLSGYIYGDTKGRFRDGNKIVTSTVMSEEGDIFRTRSGNTYRIGNWADGTPTVAANDNPAVTRELVDEVAQAHVENAGRDLYSSAGMQAGAFIYLDLDGVLADFDAGAGAALGTDNTYKWEWTHGTKAFWDKLDADDEFFFKLPPMPDAMLLFGAVRHLRPIVLTALPNTNAEGVAKQKVRWVKKYLGDDVVVITCLTSEKPNYCFAGDILVDDRNVNAAAWEARGGRYVLHTDARSSVEKLQKMGVI